jgi:formate hydrogenlyase regulatory protein HycA
MTDDFIVVVRHGSAGEAEHVTDASSADSIGKLIAALPSDGSVTVERANDPADFALACPLPSGWYYVQCDDGRGGSAHTERSSSAAAGGALYAWATRAEGWQWAFSEMHRMPVPERIPVAHEPGYRTDLVGSWDGGQFFAGFCGVTYLHLFDEDGRHERSQIAVAESELGDVGTDLLMAQLEEIVNALPGRRFGSIAIRPFSVEHGGRAWGLFDLSEDHGLPHAELEPDMLGFSPPWNGLYST